ncbi:MAG: hypothetical protein J6D31_06060 [Clostridia bacterium]|nr:hypothetical protein [Clostridia bacterium]
MKKEEMGAHVAAAREAARGGAVWETSCELIVYLLANCELTLPKENRFFGDVNTRGLLNGAYEIDKHAMQESLAEGPYAAGLRTLAYTGDADFGHTCPGWARILRLGLPGLRQSLAEREASAADVQALSFYRGAGRVLDAALAFVHRAAEQASAAGRQEMARGLFSLEKQPPQSLYEAMQLMLVYYRLQHDIEGTNLRTLGRLDRLLASFYHGSEEENALLGDFLCALDALRADANIPFALGGVGDDGACAANALTEALLQAYQAGQYAYIKLHLLVTQDMPAGLLQLALRGVRDGKNSIVFLGDETVRASLVRLGARPADAAAYHVVGCYECGAEEELTCSCSTRVNLPKALELALGGGCDMLTGEQIGIATETSFPSFESLVAAYEQQLAHLVACAIAVTDLHERHFGEWHASPIFSTTYQIAVEQGRDLYAGHGARYNNSSLNAVGLATVIDSLAAIRYLVYEEKKLSMGELIALLRADWAGGEALRLFARQKCPKYGMGDAATDALAQGTIALLDRLVNGHPNTRGGVYRLGTFSIDWRWALGEHTAASADGRHAGEVLSQNTGATFGADRKGVTAHMRSVASLGGVLTPNGSILDLDLHRSAVQGEDGPAVMASALRAYFARGGFAVHYNVLDADTLRAAKADPAAYPHLQVRLCGWNVLFSTLSEREKEEFIRRFDEKAV